MKYENIVVDFYVFITDYLITNDLLFVFLRHILIKLTKISFRGAILNDVTLMLTPINPYARDSQPFSPEYPLHAEIVETTLVVSRFRFLRVGSHRYEKETESRILIKRK